MFFFLHWCGRTFVSRFTDLSHLISWMQDTKEKKQNHSKKKNLLHYPWPPCVLPFRQRRSAIENGYSATSVDILTKICEILKCGIADIQPEELDHYEAIPQDIFKIVRILQTKPVKDQKMMLKMFEAQLSTI